MTTFVLILHRPEGEATKIPVARVEAPERVGELSHWSMAFHRTLTVEFTLRLAAVILQNGAATF